MANKESKSLHTINSLTFIVDRKHILLQSTKLTTETKLFALLKEYFIKTKQESYVIFYSPNCFRPIFLWNTKGEFLMNLCTALFHTTFP